jgi:hypothetical protein
VAKETGITFDEGWTPRILRLGDSRWRSVDARWHYALEPVFRANGIKWSPLSSPLNFFRLVIAGVGTLLTLQIIKKLGLTDMQGGWVTMIPAVWVTMIPVVVAMLAWGWISGRLAERLAGSSVLQQLLYPLLQKHRSALASLLADMLPIKADTRAATASPSIRRERTGSLLTAIAIKGKRDEKSFPARVISRTPALSRHARMRGNRHA